VSYRRETAALWTPYCKEDITADHEIVDPECVAEQMDLQSRYAGELLRSPDHRLHRFNLFI
jgi:hypothetical protein